MCVFWQSRPVFITSTFQDMHAERDFLREHVFPELEARLRERLSPTARVRRPDRSRRPRRPAPE
jgi:hypothetical protein